MREPPVPKVQQPWRPDEMVISIDPRIEWPRLLHHECFQVVRNAMEAAGIFWIVGDEKKVRREGYTKR